MSFLYSFSLPYRSGASRGKTVRANTSAVITNCRSKPVLEPARARSHRLNAQGDRLALNNPHFGKIF